ncbi:MAG: LapA family protein [Bdellovibrionales bacterium]
MKYISGFLGLLILLLAVVFALSNRQPATLAFWPFGYDLAAPLCFILLAAFLGGSLLGSAFVMFAFMPALWETRRLRRELARERKRNAELEEERTKADAAALKENIQPKFKLSGLPGRQPGDRFSYSRFFSWGPR